ncbi:MAG: hypothetical protein LBT64_00025 [Puniceicoccales bacterium]|nr:hypothetical protein [Puniceicoccales bacterium]
MSGFYNIQRNSEEKDRSVSRQYGSLEYTENIKASDYDSQSPLTQPTRRTENKKLSIRSLVWQAIPAPFKKILEGITHVLLSMVKSLGIKPAIKVLRNFLDKMSNKNAEEMGQFSYSDWEEKNSDREEEDFDQPEEDSDQQEGWDERRVPLFDDGGDDV